MDAPDPEEAAQQQEVCFDNMPDLEGSDEDEGMRGMRRMRGMKATMRLASLRRFAF